jgi:hypothetical protein
MYPAKIMKVILSIISQNWGNSNPNYLKVVSLGQIMNKYCGLQQKGDNTRACRIVKNNQIFYYRVFMK